MKNEHSKDLPNIEKRNKMTLKNDKRNEINLLNRLKLLEESKRYDILMNPLFYDTSKYIQEENTPKVSKIKIKTDNKDEQSKKDIKAMKLSKEINVANGRNGTQGTKDSFEIKGTKETNQKISKNRNKSKDEITPQKKLKKLTNLDFSKYNDWLEKDFNNSQLLKVSSTFIEQKPFIFRKKPDRSKFIEEEGNRAFENQLKQIQEETEKARETMRLKTLEDNLKYKYFDQVRRNKEKSMQKFLIEQMDRKVLF